MKTKRFLSLLLCLCMVLTLLPAARLTASAVGTSTISLGTNGISGGGANWVYYGDYKNAPVKWRVLSTNGNDGVYSVGAKLIANPLFLMSEYTLDYDLVQFDPGKNTWKDSNAQIWCNKFYNNNFDSAEKATIAATTKVDGRYSNYERSSLAGDYLFFLSGEEAANSSYGFSTESRRIAYSVTSTSSPDVWWLRSPYFSTEDNAGIVEITGRQNINKVYDTWSARPAFNLNTSDVLFSSAIGSKTSTSVGANALTRLASTAPTEWKLTLLDSSRRFGIHESKVQVIAGSTITLNYSGATVYSNSAPNEYISAMIVDSSNTVLYYGRLKQPVYTADTMDVTIPSGLTTGNYTLKLFSEQCNANYETDRASAFADVQLKVDSSVPTVTSVSPSGTGTATSGNVVINFSEAMNTAVAGAVYLYADSSSTYNAVLTGGSWAYGNTVYTVPYSGLSTGVKYTLLITGFADTLGYSMVSDSSHSFTTKPNSGIYTIDSSAGNGGYISPSGRSTLAYGGNITYTITPKSDCQIDYVLVDGYSVGAVPSFTFTNVTASHTIRAVFKQPFTDVNPGCWYFKSVLDIFGRGLMIGIGGGQFDPDGQVTRGMMVTILFKLSGDDGVYTNGYSDVHHGSWYENTAAWAASKGVASGVGANSFAPENDLTREQLAVMMHNYAKYEDCAGKKHKNSLNKYSDAGSISAWAKDAMAWAVGAGIMSGDGTHLNPQGIATRAEVATMIERFEDIG